MAQPADAGRAVLISTSHQEKEEKEMKKDSYRGMRYEGWGKRTIARFARFGLMAAATLFAGVAGATEYWWVGGDSLDGDGTSWSDEKNWATNESRTEVASEAPGTSDTVNFTVANSTVTLSADTTVAAIFITENITIDFNQTRYTIGYINISSGKTLTVQNANKVQTIGYITGGGNIQVTGSKIFRWEGMTGISNIGSFTDENTSASDNSLIKLAGGTLNVLGDFTVDNKSKFNFLGYGDINVTGDVTVNSELVFTPDAASSAIITAHPYYTIKMTAASVTAGALNGGATIETTGGVTASGGTFYGTIVGTGGLTSNGDFIMQGRNTLTGTITISEGKSLKVGNVFDDTLSGKICWKIAGDDLEQNTYNADKSINSFASMKANNTLSSSNVNGSHYATAISSSEYFGGRKVIYLDGETGVTGDITGAYVPSSTYSRGSIFVYQRNAIPLSSEYLTYYNYSNYNNSDVLYMDISGNWGHKHGSTRYDEYIYWDGEHTNTGKFSCGRKSVVSVVEKLVTSSSRKEGIGKTFAGAIAEAVGFNTSISLEQRSAAETYLMQKWSCDASSSYQPLTTASEIIVGASASLDLGIFTNSIAKLTIGDDAVIKVATLPDDRTIVKSASTISLGTGVTVIVADDEGSDTMTVSLSDDGKSLIAIGADAVHNVSVDSTVSGSHGQYLSSITKTGEGVMTYLGYNNFTGDIKIEEGTFKIGSWTDAGAVKVRFDVSDDNTQYEYVKDDNGNNTTSVSNIASLVGNVKMYHPKDSYTTSGHTYTQTPPTIVQDSDILGGHKALRSTSFRMVGDSNYISQDEALTTFIVAQYPISASGALLSDWNDVSYKTRYGFGVNYSTLRYYDYNTYSSSADAKIWVNGVSKNAVRTKPFVFSTIQYPARTSKDARNPSWGGRLNSTGSGSDLAIGEVIMFSGNLNSGARQVVEAHLASKWGVEYTLPTNTLPVTANLSLSTGATLDLNGYNQTVASFVGGGTIANGILRVTSNVYTNNGTLSMTAVSGTTIVLDDGATSLTLTGDASGVTIKATESFLTSGATVVIYAEGLTASSFVDFPTDRFRFGVTNKGNNTWSVGAETSGFSSETYTWSPDGNSTDWTSLANWAVDGYNSVGVLPQQVDTVVFPASGAPWSVALASEVIIDTLTANGAVSFSGDIVRTKTADGLAIITLGNDSGICAYNVSKSELNISAPIHVTAAEGHTAKIYGQTISSSSDDGSTITFSGNLTGNGYIEFKGKRQSATMSGDWRLFSGHISIPHDEVDSSSDLSSGGRNKVVLTGDNTYSSLAYWSVTNHSYLVESGSDKTAKFGSLEGYLNMQNALGQNVIYEIGYQNKELMELDGTCSRAEKRYAEGIVISKVGTGKLQFSGTRVSKYQILNGTLLIEKNEGVYGMSTDTAYYNVPISFLTRTEDNLTGGVLKLGASVTHDISVNIVNSTAPIAFDTADRNYVWEHELASSNTGGLTKKGAGTLILSKKPMYSGKTTVEEGYLVVNDTTFDYELGDNTEADVDTVNKKITFYKKPTEVIESIEAASDGSSVNVPLTVSFLGDLNVVSDAKVTLNLQPGHKLLKIGAITGGDIAVKVIGTVGSETDFNMTSYYKASSLDVNKAGSTIEPQLDDSVKPTLVDDGSKKPMEVSTTSGVTLNVDESSLKRGLYYAIGTKTSPTGDVTPGEFVQYNGSNYSDIDFSASLPDDSASNAVKYYVLEVSDTAPATP